MDLGFFRRAEARLAGCAPARLDFDMLVETLRVRREADLGGAAMPLAAAAPRIADPIAEILLAGPAWREAVAAQGGCFNADFARQGAVN